MFIRKITLRLFETDATGVIYFAQQFRMAQETFEYYLQETGHAFGHLLREGKFLLPVVHAEGDFSRPLRVGDEIEIRLGLERLGNSSFTLGCLFYLTGGVLAGKTSIVHVVLDRGSWQSTPITEELIDCLHELGPVS